MLILPVHLRSANNVYKLFCDMLYSTKHWQREEVTVHTLFAQVLLTNILCLPVCICATAIAKYSEH